jgi:hypothetical protein
VAAEVIAPHPDSRAYIVIIPQTPNRREHPDRWLQSGTGEAWLRDPSDITGYEIRYLQHLAKYSDSEWGWDYDQVLGDETTRARRMFVQTIDDITPAIAPWITGDIAFQHPHMLDSSLVNSPIEGYLERLNAYPHLWQP